MYARCTSSIIYEPKQEAVFEQEGDANENVRRICSLQCATGTMILYLKLIYDARTIKTCSTSRHGRVIHAIYKL